MDVVDLDKVLDDFEFNEQNSELSINGLSKEQSQEKDSSFSNNNDFEPPVLTKSMPGDNCANVIKPSPKNAVLAYPTKTNLNVESLIEYISAGTNQISLIQQEDTVDKDSALVKDQKEPSTVAISSITLDHNINLDSKIEDSSSNQNVRNETYISTTNDKVEVKTKTSENAETISITVSPDCDTEEDISDRDLSESVQTSLSYTIDNQGLKVVGFNSTMDDISDTELESYLQQIEIEHNNTELYEPKAEINSNKSSNPNEYETGGFPDNSVSDYGLYVDKDNVINYDSISQASTVEIIDAQLPVDKTISCVDATNTTTATLTKRIDSNTNGCDSSCNDLPVSSSDGDSVVAHPTSLNIPSLVVDFQIMSAGQTPMNSDKNFTEYLETSTSSDSELGKIDDVALSEVDKALKEVSSSQENNVATINDVQEENILTCNENDSPEHSPDSVPVHLLGRMAPYWIPDQASNTCMQCNIKFTVIKRRHHCRACGQVLCSKCCCMKAKLIYLGNAESRVCLLCFEHLANSSDELNNSAGAVGGHIKSIDRPNPNNPMEYCSVIPPHQQVSNSMASPISVMVPVGVLKREGSQKNRVEKTVMFSDGIKPGSDLTKLDHNWDSIETASTSENLHKGTSKNLTEKSATLIDSIKPESEMTKIDPS